MVGNVECSMCRMKCTFSDSGAFAGAGAVYIVQYAGCIVLPAKDEDLATETGWVKVKFNLKK